MSKRALALLWFGAAVSISEIFTGGLIAPLGLARGLAAILTGHLIGTGFLALGGYISFRRGENAMESVAFSLGRRGGALAALCNVVQLAGWTVVMVVQAGSALSGILLALPGALSFRLLALILSALVVLWALIFGSPAARLNEIAVCLLGALCVVLFFEAASGSGGIAAGEGGMSFALAVELSIAMPVSWLPLAGDYARRAQSPRTAVLAPFAGYFAGSVLMYGFGLFIALAGGGDIFAFIAGSRFRFAACAVVLLSTLTTAFLDLYSAALSSGQLVKTKNSRTPVLVIGLFAVLVSVIFPAERYGVFLENFLLAIGMVFVPVYTILFIDFFVKRKREERNFRWPALGIALLGMAGYRLFSRYSVWIPTVMTMLLVALLYALFILLPGRRGNTEGP